MASAVGYPTAAYAIISAHATDINWLFPLAGTDILSKADVDA